MSPSGNNKVVLTVKSTAGTWSNAEFNTSNKAERILDEGVKHFNLDKTPPAPYVLRRESTGQSLPLAEKISDIGLVDHEVVIIQAGQPIDG
jgi:hypothetical protein